MILTDKDLLVVDNIANDNLEIYFWTKEGFKEINVSNYPYLKFSSLQKKEGYSVDEHGDFISYDDETRSYRKIKKKSIFKPKYCEIFIRQKRLLSENGDWDMITKIRRFIAHEIRIGNIPPRYAESIMEINDCLQIESETEFKIFRLSYPISIISLIEQKYPPYLYINTEKYINFLKLLIEKKGMPFEEYIQNWSDRLIKQFWGDGK